MDFRAVGNEPGWHLEIEEGKWIYGQTRVYTSVPEPTVEPQAARTTYRAQTEAHDLAIVIEGRPCGDTMSGEAFPDTVTVTLDGRRYRGCGRALH